MECKVCKPLLMGLLDGELTSEESAEVNDHLIKCSGCRHEFEELSSDDKKLRGIAFREPGEEELNRLWKSPFSRFSRISGLLLVLFGYLLLLGYGIYEFLNDREEALLPKLALMAVVTGFFILLLTVIRQRAVSYKYDPYKEVEK